MSDIDEDRLLDGTSGIADYFLPPPGNEAERIKNRRVIQHWIDNHNLPVVRVGRRIYGRIAPIREWFDKQGERVHG